MAVAQKTIIGPSISINGDISCDEDLIIEGVVRARTISNPNHTVVIGKDSVVEAEINARTILICGKMTGNVNGSEEVHLPESGVMMGDITAPKITLAKKANFRGRVTYTSSSI